MFARSIAPLLQRSCNDFPATLLTGPRQSGKTTLLKSMFPQFKYVSLEEPDLLLRLKEDPKGFLKSQFHWIIDEAQNYPELFSYLQTIIDHDPARYRFILSGSQNFLLLDSVSQTLAGRAAVLELLPLTYSEYLSHKTLARAPMKTVWDYLYYGAYPRPYQENLDMSLWYSSYIRTYIERDVRNVLNIKNLQTFQLFLKLCAGRHGQLLNLNNLGQECGISQTTATEWLNILEASYIVFRLPPYHKNFNKRIVKTPKLYFYDTAIVCQLLGIESPEHLQWHAQRGAIFEGFVICEIIKSWLSLGRKAPIFFWRDHAGLEMDCVLEKSGKLILMEIKSSETYNANFLNNMTKIKQIIQSPALESHLIYSGKESFTIKDTLVSGWESIGRLSMVPGNL